LKAVFSLRYTWRMRIAIGVAIAAIVLGIGAYILVRGAPDGLFGTDATVPAPALAQDYTNQEYRFSLRMPAGFKAGELPNDSDGKTIVLQNAMGEGIQILITPSPADMHQLTAAQIQQDIPDMRITDTQPVEVGDSYQGVAFKSDNSAFGGASREVWFVFHGNLYQISTYARFDPLLKEMFATWRFY